jgi:hypothetical protein
MLSYGLALAAAAVNAAGNVPNRKAFRDEPDRAGFRLRLIPVSGLVSAWLLQNAYQAGTLSSASPVSRWWIRSSRPPGEFWSSASRSGRARSCG